MVRKASQPDEVKIRRKRVTDEGLKVDLLIRWNINEITMDDVDGESRTEYEYDEEKYTVTVDDGKDEVDDFVKNNKNILKIKGKAKAEHRKGKSIMTQTEKDELKNQRQKKGKGA